MRPRCVRVAGGFKAWDNPAEYAGTIDADYRGEIGIILVNLSSEPFTVNDGERICQMVIAAHSHVDWEPVETLDDTERGAGGFGHTGKE